MNTTLTHTPDVLCNICDEPMGVFNAVTSLQMVCCSTGNWFHKLCLKKQAFELEDEFKCPNCADDEAFRENMMMNGIFIPKSSAIALYQSFDETEPGPASKKRRIHKQWIYEQTFSSKKAVDEFLAAENWGYHYENKSDAGLRINYRCKLVKFRGQQCAAAVYVLFDSRSDRIQLFRADADHTHDNDPNAIDVISLDVQNAIRELYENNVTKPKAVTLNLLRKGFDAPPSAKLKTFLKKLNETKYGNDKINCGTLEKWLEENSALPDSDTQPFVLNYEMNYENEANIEFRFIVSNKLLLKQAIGSRNLHSDATYKILWHGFPILVVGITDLCRKFHPMGVAVCTSEQQKDFEFIFAAVKQAIHNIFDVEFEPEYLIADAAGAIQNAAKQVFGLFIQIIMCWFHAHKNISDKVPMYLKELSKQKEFFSDLDQLQVSKTKEIFDIAVQLFMDKWRNESKELIEYFEKQWVLKNGNWFEAFAKLTPSTNNAVESNNRVMKDDHTLRDRMELGKFLIKLFEMINSWTMEYVSGIKAVTIDAPEIKLDLWTKGYQFAKANVKVTSRKNGAHIIYRSTAIDKIDDSTDWNDFDSFKKNSFSFHDTKFEYPTKRENWLCSECDCRDYFKLYICEHIIGIAIRLKLVVPPVEAKNVPIGQKRKRGRPAKAKSALVRQ